MASTTSFAIQSISIIFIFCLMAASKNKLDNSPSTKKVQYTEWLFEIFPNFINGKALRINLPQSFFMSLMTLSFAFTYIYTQHTHCICIYDY